MAAINLNGPPILPDFGPVDESDIEAELEVDQLDSDSDDDDATKPSKNGAAQEGERVPGHTLLSAVRIENVIQADGVTGNLALSREGLFLLSVATEEFIKRLIQAGHREASAHRRNMINYNDMAATTRQYQEFMFLSDTIPACMSLAEALRLRQRRERELLEDNPAMALTEKEREILEDNPGMAPPWPPSTAIPGAQPTTMSDIPKSTKRSRSSNGKEKANGSAASTGPTNDGHQMQNVDVEFLPADKEWDMGPASLGGESSNYLRSTHNEISSASASSSIPPPSINGHSPGISRSLTPPLSQNGSEHGAIPLQSRYPDSHSRSSTPPFQARHHPEWFTGPASFFLRSPVASFVPATQNPGRTIYSQSTSQRPD